MRTSALFGAKSSRFSEIYGVSERTRLNNADILRTKEGGQFFAILSGRLLWTAPNVKKINSPNQFPAEEKLLNSVKKTLVAAFRHFALLYFASRCVTRLAADLNSAQDQYFVLN